MKKAKVVGKIDVSTVKRRVLRSKKIRISRPLKQTPFACLREMGVSGR